MSARWTVPLAVLGLVVGCSGSPAPAPTASASKSPHSEQGSTPRVAPAEPGQLPVPEAVAKLHRTAFDPTDAEAKLAPPICFITIHDAPLRRGDFFPAVIFADGSIGTWRQTPAGAEELFSAKLTPSEQARAAELIGAMSEGRALARNTFDASAVVVGVSTRVDERVETLYFDHERMPAALGHLTGMLKQTLEAKHRRP